MTELTTSTTPDAAPRTESETRTGSLDSSVDTAVEVADAAAQAAGVTVREIHDLRDLEEVVALYSTIWGRATNPPVTIELLRAFAKAGNYVGGAYEGSRLLGACVGFFAAPADDSLHSHIAGVSGSAVGRHVGFSLKLHQRSWALLRGVSEIAWTFDPLVGRNAHFNLAKLAAQPVEYLPNFYGAMLDSINGVDDSDRLLVRWRLRDPAVVAACAGIAVRSSAADELARGATVALGVSDLGFPLPGRLDGDTSLVAVPTDVAALRLSDNDAATQWRLAVRRSMTALVEGGARITGFDRAGWYVLRRPSADESRS